MKLKNIVIFIWVSLLLSGLALRVCDKWSFKQSTPGDEAEEYAAVYAEEIAAEEALAAQDTIAIEPTIKERVAKPAKAIVPGVLNFLPEALAQAGDTQIRVVHYGDSQIEEDRITSTLRHHLQSQYGGRGVGLVPLHQTIPTLTLKQRLHINNQVVTPQNGPQRYLLYGPKYMRMEPTDSLYGPMAQVAVMNDSLVPGSENMMLTLLPLAGSTRHRSIRLLADTGIHISERVDTVMLSGKGRVWGLSLEDKTGVYVDNIPMRGCIGTVFTAIDSRQLSEYYQQTNTKLIILQYGGNAIPQNKKETTIRGICYALRDQIRYLRSLAPETDIIFIGPSDMLETDENGQLWTNPLVPFMDETLETLMQREGVPYYSLYNAMGGEGSMLQWQEKGWAGKDGIHFTRAGADHAGEALWKWLEAMINANDNANENDNADDNDNEDL